MMFHEPFNHVNEIFGGVNSDLVRKCAIRTTGSHGPSRLGTNFWIKILYNSTFGNASDNLCHAWVLLARMLCSEELGDPKNIEGIFASRLVPLNKSPGVRPIGVGKVLQRIIGKSILTVLKSDVLNFTGNKNLCAGLEWGSEVEVHAVSWSMKKIWHMDSFRCKLWV